VVIRIKTMRIAVPVLRLRIASGMVCCNIDSSFVDTLLELKSMAGCVGIGPPIFFEIGRPDWQLAEKAYEPAM